MDAYIQSLIEAGAPCFGSYTHKGDCDGCILANPCRARLYDVLHGFASQLGTSQTPAPSLRVEPELDVDDILRDVVNGPPTRPSRQQPPSDPPTGRVQPPAPSPQAPTSDSVSFADLFDLDPEEASPQPADAPTTIIKAVAPITCVKCKKTIPAGAKMTFDVSFKPIHLFCHS